MFLAPKIKYCLTFNEFGIIQQHMTFKGFDDSKRLLDRSKYSDMLEGKKISAMLPRLWKKSFNNGIVIPAKMKRCDECKDKVICMICNIKVIENKEFEAILNLLKWKALNQFGLMLPYFEERVGSFVIVRLLYKLFSFFSFIFVGQISKFFGFVIL